jgi:hypothetical protein
MSNKKFDNKFQTEIHILPSGQIIEASNANPVVVPPASVPLRQLSDLVKIIKYLKILKIQKLIVEYSQMIFLSRQLKSLKRGCIAASPRRWPVLNYWEKKLL